MSFSTSNHDMCCSCGQVLLWMSETPTGTPRLSLSESVSPLFTHPGNKVNVLHSMFEWMNLAWLFCFVNHKLSSVFEWLLKWLDGSILLILPCFVDSETFVWLLLDFWLLMRFILKSVLRPSFYTFHTNMVAALSLMDPPGKLLILIRNTLSSVNETLPHESTRPVPVTPVTSHQIPFHSGSVLFGSNH